MWLDNKECEDDMAKATIEINLTDGIMHQEDWGTGKEVIYSTCIDALIYDEDGFVIASDCTYDDYTSEYFITNEGETFTNRETPDENIVQGYMGTIKYIFKRIEESNEDWHTFWKSMQPTDDFYLDREDREYNEDLWYQYKPLYDLFNKKGITLNDLTVIY